MRTKTHLLTPFSMHSQPEPATMKRSLVLDLTVQSQRKNVLKTAMMISLFLDRTA
jgi:hypothetical protein